RDHRPATPDSGCRGHGAAARHAARRWPHELKGGTTMPSKVTYDPGWQWDDIFPLSQAVKVGNFLYLSGQVAMDPDGRIIGKNDLRAQSRQIFENMKTVLTQAGATFADIIKITKFFTADIGYFEVYHVVRREYLRVLYMDSTRVQVEEHVYFDVH